MAASNILTDSLQRGEMDKPVKLTTFSTSVTFLAVYSWNENLRYLSCTRENFKAVGNLLQNLFVFMYLVLCTSVKMLFVSVTKE